MKRNLLLLLLAVFLVSCEDDELELPFLGEFTVPDLPYAVHDEIRMTNVGEADTYHWDFGDGTTSTLREPSHAYKKPGAYSIKLVTKHKGQESRVYREVKVGRYYAYEVELLQYADNYWLEGGAASGPSVGDPNVFLQVLDMNQEANNVLFNSDTLQQVNHGMLPLKWELKKKVPLGIGPGTDYFWSPQFMFYDYKADTDNRLICASHIGGIPFQIHYDREKNEGLHTIGSLYHNGSGFRMQVKYRIEYP